MTEESPAVHQASRSQVARGVVLAVLLSFISIVPFGKLLGFAQEDQAAQNIFLFVSRVLFWLALLAMYLYARRVEQQDFFIWKEQRYSFGIHVAFFFVTLIALIILLLFVAVALKALGIYTVSEKAKQIRETFRMYPVFGVFTCLTAGVVEEFIFRGYMLPRLEFLLRNRFASILISTLIFGLLHYGWGTLMNVIGPFVIGGIFAIHYSYFRNIKFLVFFHFFWDMVAVFMPHR
ncbi:MAG: CPBP family intramembrane glutamic endopeptidase [Bacteroidia bacterium]